MELGGGQASDLAPKRGHLSSKRACMGAWAHGNMSAWVHGATSYHHCALSNCRFQVARAMSTNYKIGRNGISKESRDVAMHTGIPNFIT